MVAILLMLASCKVQTRVETNHPALMENFMLFEKEAEKRGVKLHEYEIALYASTVMDTSWYGVCYKMLDERIRLVLINRHIEFTVADLEQLTFHELGHCILNRDHYDERDSLGNFISIMNTHTIIDDYWEKRKYYLDELFAEKN